MILNMKMISSSFLLTLIVLLVSHPNIVLSFGDDSESDLGNSISICDSILGSWIGNVEPQFEIDDLTLSVNLTSQFDVLKGKDCFAENQV
jgi:hypothetical protein